MQPLLFKFNSIMRGLSFSIKRMIGITSFKQRFVQKTGIPTTKHGLERKIGSSVVSTILDIIKRK